MKRKILLMLLLVGPMMAMAQKSSTNFLGSLEKLGYTEVEWTYFASMKKAAKGLDMCSADKKGCNQKELIQDKKMPAIKQIQKAAKSGSNLQKAMAEFEMGAYKTKDNKVLSWIVVQSVFEKYPGYSYQAMKDRMGYLIITMEN